MTNFINSINKFKDQLTILPKDRKANSSLNRRTQELARGIILNADMDTTLIHLPEVKNLKNQIKKNITQIQEQGGFKRLSGFLRKIFTGYRSKTENLCEQALHAIETKISSIKIHAFTLHSENTVKNLLFSQASLRETLFIFLVIAFFERESYRYFIFGFFDFLFFFFPFFILCFLGFIRPFLGTRTLG